MILLYYIFCIVAQSYMYCWYGTELEERMKKVAVAVYEIDWTFSTPAEVKSLTLMILIAQKGSTISYKGLCSLSNETFGWVRENYTTLFNEKVS
ncbi:odorant receptor 49b-like [Leptopilina boulardi]|uniref:odorant receptor 49b-like n=1 Tax=Leptopilina boulardi TaxID=63433 RepID=UPI0021F5B65B|nr:odorant receptor 49b-like [Leptopilina boulardi]